MYENIIKTKRTKLYLVETTLALAIALAINVFLMPNRPAFEGVEPNPLWIVVIGIAARYGRNGAIFAGVMTSLLFFGHYTYVYGTNVFMDDLWLLRYPFLFMLVGFMIGEIKQVFNLREDYLIARMEELENQNDKLKKENDIIKEAHRDLTVDVATNQDTITILNEMTTRMKSLNASTIYRGILDNFKDYLGAEESSFYALEGNLLTLQCSLGWKDYYKRPTTYEKGQGLIGLAASLSQMITIKDILLKRVPAAIEQMDMLGDTVLALPVLGIENQIYGIASIEKIPLLKMTDSSLQTAKTICDLAASSLSNARSFSLMEEKQIKDPEYNIYKYPFFLSRLEEEFLRSLNYMLPLSIMAFRWPNVSALPIERQRPVIESIVTLIRTNLRNFDILARGPVKEVPLVLMLATTSGPQANGLKQKITDKINEYGFDKALTDQPLIDTITVADFSPNKVKDANDMLKVLGL